MPTWLAPESRVFVPTIMFLQVLSCCVGEPVCFQGKPLVFRDSRRPREIPQLAPVIAAEPRAFNVQSLAGPVCLWYGIRPHS